MRVLLFSLSVVLLGVSTASIAAPALPAELSATSYYAVDFAGYASTTTMSCLQNYGYKAAFVRAYNPTGNGAYDPYSGQTIHNACYCFILEVYMTPQPMSTKPGYMQFDEMYSGLRNNGIYMNSSWVQVVSPSHWSTNIQTNIAFVQSILSRMRQYGIKPGIYTNYNDWHAITGNWLGAGQDVMLWYANVRGSGPSGETSPDFGDYVQIGSWQFPTGKQFGQVESFCGMNPLNRDIFVSPSPNFAAYVEGLMKLEKAEKPNVITVGHLWRVWQK